MKTKTQIAIVKNGKQTEFSELDGIKPMSAYSKDCQAIGLFKFLLKFDDIAEKSYTTENLVTYRKLKHFVTRSISDRTVSSYQVSCLSKITTVIYEAKSMNEAGLLCDNEFTDILDLVLVKILNRFEIIKKQCMKAEISKNNFNPNSINSLRAKVASLSDEN